MNTVLDALQVQDSHKETHDVVAIVHLYYDMFRTCEVRQKELENVSLKDSCDKKILVINTNIVTMKFYLIHLLHITICSRYTTKILL